jgi:hypothetical protein
MIDPTRRESILEKVVKFLFGDLISPDNSPKCSDTPDQVVKRAKERRKKKDGKKH